MTAAKYFDKLHEVWRHEIYLDMSPFHHTRKRLILSLLGKSVGPESSVLDVGCGIGDLMLTLLRLGAEADGTDVALSSLHVAKRKFPHANLVLSDARWLPFRADHYSVVVCSEVLEHVDNHSQVAEEINRILAPGGIAVLTVPHGEQHWTWEDQVDGHLRRYTRKQFVDLMKETGFMIDAIKCWGFPLAVLFRKTISTPLYNRGFHESKDDVRNSLFFNVLLRLIVALFRLDDLFHGTQLGLGLVSRLRKPFVFPNATTDIQIA